MLEITVGGKRLPEALVRSAEICQALGTHNRCTVVFSRDDFLRSQMDEFLAQRLTISLSSANEPSIAIFDGFVSTGTLQHQLYGGSAVCLEGTSDSAKLDWSRREAYYKQKPLIGIARELAGKNGVRIEVTTLGPALNYVQRGETDFEFLKRIADDCGCFVRPTPGGAEIRKGFSTSGLMLTWNDDLLAFQVIGRLVPRKVRGTHYDLKQKKGMRYQKVAKDGAFTGAYDNVVSAVQNGSTGALASQEHLEFHNARVVTLEDYKKLLEKESSRALSSSVSVEGESMNPRLLPGEYVDIKDVPEGGGQYGLVSVVHQYDALGGYRNHFWATPSSDFTNAQKPEKAMDWGVVTALVVDNNDPTKLNRLRIRYHWQEGDSTSWTRMITQYAGKARGVMFLPEIGDEVVVAFENGDPERPIIIGSVWNGKDLAPRDPYREQDDIRQNEVKRIITKSGNAIEIVDTKGKEAIELHTANKACIVQLDNEKKTITLMTGRSKLVLAADGRIQMTGVHVIVEGEDVLSRAKKQHTIIGEMVDINP